MNELTAKEARELVLIQKTASDAVRWRELENRLLENIKDIAKKGKSSINLIRISDNILTKLKFWLIPLGYTVERKLITSAQIKW